MGDPYLVLFGLGEARTAGLCPVLVRSPRSPRAPPRPSTQGGDPAAAPPQPWTSRRAPRTRTPTWTLRVPQGLSGSALEPRAALVSAVTRHARHACLESRICSMALQVSTVIITRLSRFLHATIADTQIYFNSIKPSRTQYIRRSSYLILLFLDFVTVVLYVGEPTLWSCNRVSYYH